MTPLKKKERFLAALEQQNCIVSDAAKACKIPRQTHYRWLKEDADYKKKVDELEDVPLDYVESKLFSEIENGNITGIIFYLKMKGKKRGYGEDSTARDNVLTPYEIKVVETKQTNKEK